MATVGQSLTSPEAGWKRYDDTDVNILYSGTWTISPTNASYYNSTFTYSTDTSAKIKFNFTGSKIRIIGVKDPNYSSNITIKIDETIYTFSQYQSSGTISQCLNFEQTGLEDKEHYVEISFSSGRLGLDAIDIDSTKELKPYSIPRINKILIQLSNGEIISVENEGYSNAIPIMTSNNTPEGEVIYSSVYSTYYPYYAFDGIIDAIYRWIANGRSGYIGYKFTTKKNISRYKIHFPSGVSTTLAPKTWTFEGSNDGVNWVVLDSQSNQTFNSPETKTFDFNNNNEYLYYRLNVTANNGHANLSIGELEMFENSLKLKSIPSSSEQDFINHGMDKSTVLDLSQTMSRKSFVEKNTITLGSGKVFSKSIDTTQLPIKKLTIK